LAFEAKNEPKTKPNLPAEASAKAGLYRLGNLGNFLAESANWFNYPHFLPIKPLTGAFTNEQGAGLMQIRYVVSSMLFWWRENNLSLEQECQFLKSQGFGIELWPTIRGQEECRYERRNWPRLAAATDGMLVSMRSRQGKHGGISL
jgi:hypothetical protein